MLSQESSNNNYIFLIDNKQNYTRCYLAIPTVTDKKNWPLNVINYNNDFSSWVVAVHNDLTIIIAHARLFAFKNTFDWYPLYYLKAPNVGPLKWTKLTKLHSFKKNKKIFVSLFFRNKTPTSVAFTLLKELPCDLRPILKCS
jgi:hypothetical protein